MLRRSNRQYLRLINRNIQCFNPVVKFKKETKNFNALSVSEAVKRLVNNDVQDKDLPSKWPKVKNRYLTSPKEAVVEDINNVVKRLVTNDYVEKSGSASRLIYGEKGIGKSSALTLSVMGIWAAYSNVIPIYIEYVGSAKEYQAPSDVLSATLGVEPSMPLSKCIETLQNRNLYALIIADEIEQIYAGTDYPEKRKLVLDELTELGSQASGHMYTYICGSSSLVPVLISKNAVHNEELRMEFPFVQQAPILNGKKYAGFRIHRGMHGQRDLQLIQAAYGLSKDTANLVYYLCGSNLRSVDQVVSAMTTVEESNTDAMIISIKERCDSLARWDQRAVKTRSEQGPLINALLNKMVHVNMTIIKRAVTNISEVTKIDWIKDVRALSRHEVMEVCHRLGINDPEYSVNLLVDKGYFSGPPQLDFLLPNKPSELIDYYPKYQRWEWVTTAMKQYFPSLFKYFKKSAADTLVPGAIDSAVSVTDTVLRMTMQLIRAL